MDRNPSRAISVMIARLRAPAAVLRSRLSSRRWTSAADIGGGGNVARRHPPTGGTAVPSGRGVTPCKYRNLNTEQSSATLWRIRPRPGRTRKFPFKTATSRRKRLRPCRVESSRVESSRVPTVSAATSNELFSEGRPLPKILEEVAWLAQLPMQAYRSPERVRRSCIRSWRAGRPRRGLPRYRRHPPRHPLTPAGGAIVPSQRDHHRCRGCDRHGRRITPRPRPEPDRGRSAGRRLTTAGTFPLCSV